MICLGQGTKTRKFYDDLFASNGLNLEPDIEAATTDQVLPMVKCGIGIGFVPEGFARSAMEARDIFKVDLAETIPERQICLIRDKTRPAGAAASELVKKILENAEGAGIFG